MFDVQGSPEGGEGDIKTSKAEEEPFLTFFEIRFQAQFNAETNSGMSFGQEAQVGEATETINVCKVSVPEEPIDQGEGFEEEPQEVTMINTFEPGLIHEERFFSFWANELKANDWVLNTLKKGYMIPFSK